MSEFIARVGTFFYLMAIGLLVLFFASDVSSNYSADIKTNYDLFFVSLILFVMGFIFRKRAAPPPAADRFRIFRRYRDNQKQKQEEKAKEQQQKK